MKVFIVLAALVAIVVARPTAEDAAATILKSSNENIGVGPWHWDVETSNGIKQEESGQITNEGQENEAIAVRGSYSFTGPDGVVYTVTYIADENGFQPEGAHLPKPAEVVAN